MRFWVVEYEENYGEGGIMEERKEKKKLSMHEGIGIWCDCCPCEAEPRWRDLAEELEIDLSDYEEG